MKKVLNPRNLLIIALGCSVPLSGAVAGKKPMLDLHSLSGSTVMDGFGGCVNTSAYSQPATASSCDAIAKVEEMTQAAPPAAVHRQTTVQLTDKGNVLFDFDSANLNSNADSELQGLMSKINQYENVDSITITGHTDSTGPDSYNQGLSERRASSIRDYLSSKGINTSVLSASGMGEANPIASNASRDGRAQNRRVDIVINGEVKQ